MYEISEEKRKQCKELNLDISPSDFEWVIDIFEKSAINDKRQDKPYLIEMFQKRAPADVEQRVTKAMME